MKIKTKQTKNNSIKVKMQPQIIIRAIIIFMLILCMLVPTFATVVYADTISVEPETQEQITDAQLQYEGDIGGEVAINDSEDSYKQYGCKINLQIDFLNDFTQQNLHFSFYNVETGVEYTDTLYFNSYYMSDSYKDKKIFYQSYCLPEGKYEISVTCSNNVGKYFIYIDNRILDKNNIAALTDGMEFSLLAYTKDDVENIGNLQTYLENFGSNWTGISENEFDTKEEIEQQHKEELKSLDDTEDSTEIDADEEENTNASIADTVKDVIIFILGVALVIFIIVRTIKMKNN